jgi:hypothetical protein
MTSFLIDAVYAIENLDSNIECQDRNVHSHREAARAEMTAAMIGGVFSSSVGSFRRVQRWRRPRGWWR